MRLLIGVMFGLMLYAPIFASGRTITIDDLLGVKSVSEPQLSPDGRWVVYVVSELDRATDKTSSDLWLVATTG
ncbi:S9 family peptidase, partial [Singulisphaera rosea]